MSNKQPTKAVSEAMLYRDVVNKGRQKIMAKDYSCVVYIYANSKNQPCAIGYVGRAKKPSFCYRYASEIARSEAVVKFIESCSDRPGRRKANERTLEVGDVLRASWGYDQTNIDYFQVVGLIGKTMVSVVEIGQVREGDGFTGTCIPDPSVRIGEVMKRKADGDAVKINSCVRAYKTEVKNIAGVKLYNTDHYTSYH